MHLHGDVEELPRYGLKNGLKNFAAHATGLLCARRLLQKVGLDELYEGNDDPDGEVVSTEAGKKTCREELGGDKRPFKCLLDVGVTTTTTGHRVFAALKGASDGGLDIPQPQALCGLRQGGQGVRRRGHGRPHQRRPRQ